MQGTVRLFDTYIKKTRQTRCIDSFLTDSRGVDRQLQREEVRL